MVHHPVGSCMNACSMRVMLQASCHAPMLKDFRCRPNTAPIGPPCSLAAEAAAGCTGTSWHPSRGPPLQAASWAPAPPLIPLVLLLSRAEPLIPFLPLAQASALVADVPEALEDQELATEALSCRASLPPAPFCPCLCLVLQAAGASNAPASSWAGEAETSRAPGQTLPGILEDKLDT